jgi:hypothetical protein
MNYILYPLFPQKDYTELKYSLRSVEMFVKKPYEIIIVGSHIPEWLTGVTQIEFPDVPGQKQLSIRRKILAGLQYAKKPVFFMNDDHFLLRETDIKKYPYYYYGTMFKIRESGSKPLIDRLKELKKPDKHFDIHTPIIYNEDFGQVISNFPDACILKSAYCNYLEIEGEPITDFKVMKDMSLDIFEKLIKDRPCFSTGPSGVKSALLYLKKKFPNPSKFEL